jgi:hypothetical protein
LIKINIILLSPPVFRGRCRSKNDRGGKKLTIKFKCMKKQIIISALLLSAVFASAQNCFWAKGIKSNISNIGNNIAADNSGNIYVTGYFYDAGITIGTVTLTNHDILNQTGDIYIAKYDSLGNVLWAKNYGGNSGEESYDITVDAGNNIPDRPLLQ